MKKYVIINTDNTDNFDTVEFNLLEQNRLSTCRQSLDKSLTLLSFYGNTPSFLEGLTEYNNSEIIEIVTSSDWEIEEE
tara:strand:- start:410 stop:643 length:234 start_codon:yes stop_codon:yes gene_type:complete